ARRRRRVLGPAVRALHRGRARGAGLLRGADLRSAELDPAAGDRAPRVPGGHGRRHGAGLPVRRGAVGLEVARRLLGQGMTDGATAPGALGTTPVAEEGVPGSDRPVRYYLADTRDGPYAPYALRTPSDDGVHPFVFLAYGNGGGGLA